MVPPSRTMQVVHGGLRMLLHGSEGSMLPAWPPPIPLPAAPVLPPAPPSPPPVGPVPVVEPPHAKVAVKGIEAKSTPRKSLRKESSFMFEREVQPQCHRLARASLGEAPFPHRDRDSSRTGGTKCVTPRSLLRRRHLLGDDDLPVEEHRLPRPRELEDAVHVVGRALVEADPRPGSRS